MIKRKDFERGNFKRRSLTTAEEHPVARILKKYFSWALNAKEITQKTKMKENTVRGRLTKLVKAGWVKHKSPYYAWKRR